MKLSEKWDSLIIELRKLEWEYIISIYPVHPTVFYKIEMNGALNECFITGIHYTFPFPTYYSGKRPDKKDVLTLSDNINKLFPFDEKRVYFDYKYIWDEATGRTASTAISGKDLFSDKIFFDHGTAVIKSEEVKLKVAADKLWYEQHKKPNDYNYDKNGYKFLGWQNGWRHVYFDEDHNVTEDRNKSKTFGYLTADYPEYGKCRDENHRKIEVSLYRSGAEHIVSCPICKIYYKYDSSD